MGSDKQGTVWGTGNSDTGRETGRRRERAKVRVKAVAESATVKDSGSVEAESDWRSGSGTVRAEAPLG